jgi:accessory colonization factor AcfC
MPTCLKLLVVQGSGQTGMWEDMAGKQGNLSLVSGLTVHGKAQPAAVQFAKFLQSKESAAIFKKWGWMAP